MENASIDELIDLLYGLKPYINAAQSQRLAELTRTQFSSPSTSSGDVMDTLLDEVKLQLDFVIRFRERVTRGGDNVTTRELKDLLQTSSSLFTMLTKMNEEITNQARLRKIENATVEAIRTLPPAEQQRFFQTLEKALER